MMYPEPLMWIVAVVLLVGGWLWLRFRRAGGYPPVWVCALVVVGALIGMWILLNYQFGGMSIGIR